MKRSIAKGTPEQLLNLVKNKIAELGGDVEACDKITASSETTYQDTNGIMGEIGDTWTISELRQYWDAEQMNDPILFEYDSFESWLEDTTRQMTLIEGDEVVSAARDDDNTYAERYIHTLIGDIQAEVQGAVESITFDQDDNNLIVTVVYDDKSVREFQVPFEDLHYDFDEIDADVAYVVNAILYDTDTYDESINSATNTCGIPAVPNMDTEITSAVDDIDIINSRT